MKKIAILAGGTGGHIFPAEALLHYLQGSSHQVRFFTDERYLKYKSPLPENYIIIKSSSFSMRRLWSCCYRNIIGLIQIIRHFLTWKPNYVISFGGYCAAPGLVAAKLLNIKIILIEGNACMGRVNRLLAFSAKNIFVNMPLVNATSSWRNKIQIIGAILKPEIYNIKSYVELANEQIEILVTGGSQASRVMSNLVPEAIKLLPIYLRQKIHMSHYLVCR